MLHDRDWKTESIVRLLMGVLLGFAVAGFLSAALSSRVSTLWPSSVVHPAKFTAFLFSVLAFHGVSIPVIWNFLREQRREWGEAFDIPGPAPKQAVFWGIVGAVVILPAAYGLQEVCAWVMEKLGHPAALQDEVQLIQSEHAWFVRGAFFVFAVLVAPVVEELLFRGIFFSALRDRGFRRLGFLVSGVVFGAIHMNLAAFLPLTVFGLVQAWLYERSGSLLTPILSHALFNLAPFVALWLGISTS